MLEEGLCEDISHMEQIYPGYDEYNCELQEISHDPYELTAYLTVCFEDYERNEVWTELLQLFSRKYTLTPEEKIEIRTREEVRAGYRTVIDSESVLESCQGFQKLIKYYAEKAGIEKEITSHTFRHSFAADLLENGADVQAVQKMMGHADVSTTQMYVEMQTENVRDIYKKYHPGS